MTDNRLSMFVPQNALYAQPQEPQTNALYYDDTQGGAYPLRWLRDQIPVVQADDSSTWSGITSRLGRTATAIPRSALNTMANWLDGTRDPSLIGPQEMVSPLGALPMVGVASRAPTAMTRPAMSTQMVEQMPQLSGVRSVRNFGGPENVVRRPDPEVYGVADNMNTRGPYLMADNAKGSTPGVVVNSLSDDTVRPGSTWYHGGPKDLQKLDAGKSRYASRPMSFVTDSEPLASHFGSVNKFSPTRDMNLFHADRDFGAIEPFLRQSADAIKAQHPWIKDPIGDVRSKGWSALETPQVQRWLQEQGYDGFRATQKPGLAPSGEVVGLFPDAASSMSRVYADNAKGSAPGTVVNSLAEGASRGRTVADELLGVGTNKDSFEQLWARLTSDKSLSKSDWSDMANHFANAPTGATYEWKFKNIDEAKRRVFDVFAERFERESKRASIERLVGFPGKSGVEASPYASTPGLAANSTQPQDDSAVTDILRRHGLAD